MRFFQKMDEPQGLTQWKRLKTEDWKPSYDNLSADVKKTLKLSLLKEQGFLCCYCERKIDDDHSHIEHFKPQSEYREFELDYNNLHCSCNGDDVGVCKKPLHCGHKKGNNYDEILICPLQSDCESHFAYFLDGKIQPACEDDVGVKKTIEILGLDIPRLCNWRSAAIEPFLDPELTESEFIDFCNIYLQPDGNGMLNPFYSTIKYVLMEFVSSG